MLTSSPRAEDAARCRALGVRAVLMKPVKASELLDTIVQTMGGGPRRSAISAGDTTT